MFSRMMWFGSPVGAGTVSTIDWKSSSRLVSGFSSSKVAVPARLDV